MNNQPHTSPKQRQGYYAPSETQIVIESAGRQQVRVMRMSETRNGIMEIEFRETNYPFQFGHRP